MTDKEKEIRQFEEQHKEELDAIYERIHVEVERNIIEQAQMRKRRQKLSYRIMSIAMACVLVLTLAIVLPIVLRTDTDDNGGGNTIVRYSASELDSQHLDFNIKRYAELNNGHWLYIDWYDVVEECETLRFYKKGNENETVYLKETLINGDTGYKVTYTIIKNNVMVDDVDILENVLIDTSEATIDKVKVSVYYISTRTRSVAKFEYNEYIYYLDFGNTIEGEDVLLEIISSMFNN